MPRGRTSWPFQSWFERRGGNHEHFPVWESFVLHHYSAYMVLRAAEAQATPAPAGTLSPHGTHISCDRKGHLPVAGCPPPNVYGAQKRNRTQRAWNSYCRCRCATTATGQAWGLINARKWRTSSSKISSGRFLLCQRSLRLSPNVGMRPDRISRSNCPSRRAPGGTLQESCPSSASPHVTRTQ